MTRECQVRICERLGVKLPGPTRRLYLQVGKTGSKSRVFRYKVGGRLYEMGRKAARMQACAPTREPFHCSYTARVSATTRGARAQAKILLDRRLALHQRDAAIYRL